MNKVKEVAVISVAAVIFSAGSVLAADYQEIITEGKSDFRTKVVNIADLNLNSEAGRLTLDSRIRQAARIVCGETRSVPQAGGLKPLLQNRKCAVQAIDGAMSQVYADESLASVDVTAFVK